MSDKSDQTAFPVILTRDASWRSDQFVVFDIVTDVDVMVNVRVKFSGGGRVADAVTGIFPRWPTRVAITLATCEGKILFVDRTPGRFKTTVHGGNIAFDALEAVSIEVPQIVIMNVTISNVHIVDAMPDHYPMPDKPVADVLHQWTGRDWPGKARDVEAVRAELEKELNAPTPAYPAGFSSYGGWSAKKFDATGWFRTQHDGNRWWLVDPDGCAFWSMGPDCVRMNSNANMAGIEKVCAVPLPAPETAPHLWGGRGDRREFNCLAHNLERALGAQATEKWMELTRRRLIGCGFNTIANWSDPAAYRYCRVPFVFTMGGFPSTDEKVFRDFPDVYSPQYEKNSQAFACQLKDSADDKYMIGFFMTNEPEWAFLGDFDLGAQLLRDGRPGATRDAFISFLTKKHGTVDALNAVWKSAFGSFDDLRNPHDLSSLPASRADTEAFTAEAISRYVGVPAKACRCVDSRHLNLGLRWAWVHHDYQLAGHEHLDAFSINCYQLKPDPKEIAHINTVTGKPVMIGEFHIGSLDRGLPSGGIRNTRTMAESANAYRYYMENAAAIPGLVGAHYFQWNDQPVLGRFDGENMQIGFNDIAYRMYPEMTDSARTTHPAVYRVALSECAPYAQEPQTTPEGTLVW